MQRTPPVKIALWLFVLIGCAFALRSAVSRYNAEKANRRVEVAVDYAEVRSLAAAQGLPTGDVLKAFRAAGANSVVLQEDTVGGLEDAGRLTVDVGRGHSGGEAIALLAKPGDGGALLRRVEEALRAKTRYQVAAVRTEAAPFSTTPIVEVSQPWAYVRGVGVGLDPAEVAEIRGAGLGIVGRVANWSGVTDRGLTWTLNELKKNGVTNIIFSGDAVLGFKGFVSDDPKDPSRGSTAAALQHLGLGYGAVEFGKQKGDPELAKAAAAETVRVHTVTGAEMVSATVPGNVQRFALAARERNIRLLFVRLFPDERDPVKFNADYVAKIVRALKRGGLETGVAHGYGFLAVGPVPEAAMGAGLAAAFVLLVDAVTGLLSGGRAGRLAAAVAVLGALACAAAPLAPSSLGPKAAAFAAAVIFPTLALLTGDLLAPSRGNPYLVALGRFLRTCAVTALGIATVVGLLADRLFLIKVDVFTGIKPSLVLPLLVVAVVAALDLRADGARRRSWPAALAGARDRLLSLAGEPLRVWQVAAGLVVLVLLVVIVARSGNDSGVGVSGFELKLRALLDRVLFARPRFKDMFGHAALVMALLLAARGRRAWAVPVFVAGAVGQVSLLNTFCHLHTPLPVGIGRALLGVGFGAIIGLVAYALLDVLVLRRLPTSAAESTTLAPALPDR
jgi:hypothetical protein